jgi:hypothetical protein
VADLAIDIGREQEGTYLRSKPLVLCVQALQHLHDLL